MSNFSQFAGGMRPPKSIINEWSAGGGTPLNIGSQYYAGVKEFLSGEVTANVYKEILAINGSGIVDIAAVCTEDATNRNIGIKVVIDGITVFDAVSGAVTTPNYGIWAIGHWFPTSTYSLFPNPVCFNKSLGISIKSSISETDKIGLRCNYKTT